MSFKFVHRNLGILLCVLLFSISISGILLVWKKEYLWLSVAQAREEVDLGLIPQAIERIEGDYPYGDVRFIQLYSEDLTLHKVFLSNRRYAWHRQNGEQIEVWSGNERLEDWLLDLHHRFLLGNAIGLNIAGFSGLLLIPLMLIGLIVWWPRRRTLKLGLWPTQLQRGSLLRSHGNVGGVSVLPVLLIALTGVILVYPVESRFVLLNGISENKTRTQDKVTAQLDSRSWDNLIAETYRRYPGSRLRWVIPATAESPADVVGLQQALALNRTGKTSLTFSPNGELTISDALAQPIKQRLFDFSYPLHVGKIGVWYRLLLTLFGLALAFLCGLGLLSFMQRRTLPK